MFVYVWVYVLDYRCPRMPEEGTVSPGAGVTRHGYLGKEFESSARAECALHQQATSLALVLLLQADNHLPLAGGDICFI